MFIGKLCNTGPLEEPVMIVEILGTEGDILLVLTRLSMDLH